MFKFTFILVFSLIGISVYSQCDSTQWAKAGTYDIISIPNTKEFVDQIPQPYFLTQDQLCLIESSRTDYHFVIIQLNENTRVKIYPRQTAILPIER